MPTLDVVTQIKAPQEVCYTLALSVDLHTLSTKNTQEEIVGGVRTGELQLGDEVTFRARHFGVWQTLTSQITEANPPNYFCDEMRRGAFKSMRHEHHFSADGTVTSMRDVFIFESPFGLLGKIFNALVLEKYMRQFLVERGAIIKQYAENGEWRSVLSKQVLVAYR
jgi:ligand-binding SRPBCC domain-containing protein